MSLVSLVLFVLTKFVAMILTDHLVEVANLPNNEICDAVQHNQVISVSGCLNKTIVNYFCKGRCISGFVPESNDFGKSSDLSCRSCKESAIEKRAVILSCENGIRVIDVEIFRRCNCVKSICKNMKTPVDLKPVQKPPCQLICRKCRKSTREYKKLLELKDHSKMLQRSCITTECRKRISPTITDRTKRKKKSNSILCKMCYLCKENKTSLG